MNKKFFLLKARRRLTNKEPIKRLTETIATKAVEKKSKKTGNWTEAFKNIGQGFLAFAEFLELVRSWMS